MNKIPPKYARYATPVSVAELLPEDGTCIRFKDLTAICDGKLPSKEINCTPKLNEQIARCKKHPISYRQLNQELKRLQRSGTVVRSKAKAQKGQGICYRRKVVTSFSTSEQIKKAIENINFNQDKVKRDITEREKIGSQWMYGALISFTDKIYYELLRYASNPNPELAERSLDSALKDFIVPMIKETTELAKLPEVRSAHAIEAIKKALLKGTKEWDMVWEESKQEPAKSDPTIQINFVFPKKYSEDFKKQ